jgi:hypothetical protein
LGHGITWNTQNSRRGNAARHGERPRPAATVIAIGFAAVSASRRLLAAILVGTALTAGVGMGVRLAVCSRPCISDLGRDFTNYSIRSDALPYLDRNLEYPVGVGIVFWGATLVSDTARSFFTVTSLFALALALLTAWLLERRYGRRAWYFALAPPLALYGSANWDLFALAPAVAGLLAYEARRDGSAGVLLGLGAAVKLYPGLFVPPLVAWRLRNGDTRGALRVAGWSAGTFAIVNLPVLIASPSGWLFPLRFQSRRTPTWGSLWHYVVRTPALHPWTDRATMRSIANTGTIVTLLAGVVVITWLVWRGRLGPIAAATAATAVFMLTNKVYSPQYDLWLVPFFVMLALPRRDYAWFVLTDLAVFVIVFGTLGHHFRWTTAWAYTLLAFVLLRAIVIGFVVRDAARADTQSPAEPTASSPMPIRSSVA